MSRGWASPPEVSCSGLACAYRHNLDRSLDFCRQVNLSDQRSAGTMYNSVRILPHMPRGLCCSFITVAAGNLRAGTCDAELGPSGAPSDQLHQELAIWGTGCPV
jgi:hypothetical protein